MKTLDRFICALFFLCFSFSSFGQNAKKIDSILQIYRELPNDTTKVLLVEDLFKYYPSNMGSEFKEYAKQQYELAKKLNFKKGIGLGLYNSGDFFYYRNKLDSTKFYYSKALKVFEEIDYMTGIAFTKRSLAKIRVKWSVPI